MHPRLRWSPLFLLAALGFGFAAPAARADDPAPKKILFFSKSSGFEHDAIKLKMKDGREGYGYPVMRDLAGKNQLEIVYSKDGSKFTPEYLAQFDGFIFYTTGDLTQLRSDARGDGNPPMTPEGKAAFLKLIEGGKGFVGIHSATDTFHSPGGESPGTKARYSNDGDNADAYIKMIGGEFIMHGAQQKSHLIVADPSFPGASAVPADFAPMEEWYTLKDFAPNLHVIFVQDTHGMEGPNYQRPPYPSTWAHMYGKGRVFYTSLGHREDIWTNPVFQSVLMGGINWSLGRVDADVTPNMDKVAPEGSTLQKFVPPAPAKQKKKKKAE